MSDELPTHFESIAGKAARNDEHTVTIEAGEYGYAIHIDGVRVSPEFPVETFTFNRGWQAHVDDGIEKAREVYLDE